MKLEHQVNPDPRFSAAIVGLGNIGIGFDYEFTDSSRILTHAAAFHYHPGFDLIAGVDLNPSARAKFTRKFGRPAFSSIDELWSFAEPDIVALSVPTELHSDLFQHILIHRPKAILCEKPLADSLERAEIMVSAAESAKVLLAVNYMRRSEPGVNELKRLLTSGYLGKPYKGVQWYSKGMLTNGSHFLDLLCFLFGPVTGTQVIKPGGMFAGFDCEPEAIVHFGDLEVYFHSNRSECFSMYELQLLSEVGELRYSGGGELIEFRRAVPHPVFAGYKQLNEEPEVIRTDLRRYQWHVLENLFQALSFGTPLHSSGKTALLTMRVIQELTIASSSEVPIV